MFCHAEYATTCSLVLTLAVRLTGLSKALVLGETAHSRLGQSTKGRYVHDVRCHLLWLCSAHGLTARGRRCVRSSRSHIARASCRMRTAFVRSRPSRKPILTGSEFVPALCIASLLTHVSRFDPRFKRWSDQHCVLRHVRSTTRAGACAIQDHKAYTRVHHGFRVS